MKLRRKDAAQAAIKTKQVNGAFEVKALTDEGKVKFFMNTFTDSQGRPFIDADNEISALGSFDNTLKSCQDWYWWVNHGRDSKFGNAVIGIIEKGYVDTINGVTGVVLEGKLNLNIQVGKEMFEHYKFMHANGKNVPHSFGFSVKQRYDENLEVWVNEEYNVMEVSTLTVPPANNYARSLEVKNSVPEDVYICDSCEKAYAIPFEFDGKNHVQAYNLGALNGKAVCPHCGGEHAEKNKVKATELENHLSTKEILDFLKK